MRKNLTHIAASELDLSGLAFEDSETGKADLIMANIYQKSLKEILQKGSNGDLAYKTLEKFLGLCHINLGEEIAKVKAAIGDNLGGGLVNGIVEENGTVKHIVPNVSSSDEPDDEITAKVKQYIENGLDSYPDILVNSHKDRRCIGNVDRVVAQASGKVFVKGLIRKEVSSSGSGDISCSGISGDITLAAHGSLSCDFIYGDAHIVISGSGDVVAKTNYQNLNIIISGSGNVNLNENYGLITFVKNGSGDLYIDGEEIDEDSVIKGHKVYSQGGKIIIQYVGKGKGENSILKKKTKNNRVNAKQGALGLFTDLLGELFSGGFNVQGVLSSSDGSGLSMINGKVKYDGIGLDEYKKRGRVVDKTTILTILNSVGINSSISQNGVKLLTYEGKDFRGFQLVKSAFTKEYVIIYKNGDVIYAD